MFTNFYYDSISSRNKVYGTSAPFSPVIACAIFSLGIVYGIDTTCADLSAGIVYGVDESTSAVDILDIGNWTASGTSTLGELEGLLSFTSTNVAITEDTVFGGEKIGIIESPGKPTQAQAIQLSEDTQIIIDTDGIIYYYGHPTSVDGSGSVITINTYYFL